MARGIEQGLIFRDDRDREDFIRRLAELSLKQAWIIYAWALMPNHFHVLVRSGTPPVAKPESINEAATQDTSIVGIIDTVI